MSAVEFPKALRTNTLVGREKEKNLIKEAIEAQDASRFVCFTGDGGLGKTRLLEEVPLILQDCVNHGRYWQSQILDFYHVDFHSGSGIERAIICQLDPAETHFGTYRQKRVQYETLLREGAYPQQVADLRAQLRDCFVQDLNVFCQDKRPVLRFDTLELLQYESDPIQEAFQSDLQSAQQKGLLGAAKGWLIDVLPQLKNTVVILAARPAAQTLITDLQTALGQALTVCKLNSLDPQETLLYLDTLAHTLDERKDCSGAETIRSVKDEVCKYIHSITNGEPLILSMVISMLCGDTIHPADLEGKTYKWVQNKILDWLLQEELPPVLSYINLLRKGVDTQRLHAATGWEISRCQQELDRLRPFVYVKIRQIEPQCPERDLFFLHDKMYEWIESVRSDLSGPQVQDVCPAIIGYYDEQIKQYPAQSDVLRIEQLYYQLLLDSPSGFAHYIWLSDDALSRQLIEYEMGLRDEMLRFYRGRLPDYVQRDLVVRWMKRFVFLREYPTAFKMSEDPLARESLQGCYTPTQTTDPYLTIDLLVTRAEAAVYWGHHTDQARSFLDTAIDFAASLASTQGSVGGRRLAFLLGRAHKFMGYLAAREKRFDDAVREYTKAIGQFENAGIDSERAYALNNRGFAFVSLGDGGHAQEDSGKAYRLFCDLNMKIGQALALNTIALIQLSQGLDPSQAELWCRKALSLSLALRDERSEGLIGIALAWALRKRGALAKLGLPEEEAFFSEAEQYARRAVSIFETSVPEAARQIEAYSQLGRVYRDWANFYRGLNLDDRVAEEKERLAEQHLIHSSDLAEENGLIRERADALEDIAEIHLNRKDYGEAFRLVDECEQVIPAPYKITAERGMPNRDDPDLRDVGLWQMLGKIDILRSRIYFAQKKSIEAVEHAFLAYTYFDLYSAYAIEPAVHQMVTSRIEENLRHLSCEDLKKAYVRGKEMVTRLLKGSRGADRLLYIVEKVFKEKCSSETQGRSQ